MGHWLKHMKKWLGWQIKSWRYSVLPVVIWLVTGIFLGMFYTFNQPDLSKSPFNTSITWMIAGCVLGLLVLWHYNYIYNERKVYKEYKERLLRYSSWLIIIILFYCYYWYHKDEFLRTYRVNQFGIDQKQYIFLVNLGLFLVGGVIFYYIIIKGYFIKSISHSGVEIDHLEEEGQRIVIQAYQVMIDDIAKEICKLDTLLNELDRNSPSLIREDYELNEYKVFIEMLLGNISKNCSPLSSLNQVLQEAKIITSQGELKDYLKYTMNYAPSVLEKVIAYLQYADIHVEDEMIFIKYQLGDFHLNIAHQVIYIILKTDELYPVQIGRLIFTYLVQMESIYSKYL